ncbi:DMT family transporter [Nioella sp.]|uniref:DMT family transporter n=1 Tax=Nioella sp. TaxID=1912091 RepID=UPI003518146A
MQLKGALFALLAFGIFATHDVVIKYLGGTYNAIQIIFFSVLFSFPMLTLVMIRDARGDSLRPVHPWWTGARTVSGALGAACAFYAFSVLPLTQVYPILFAMPLLVTLLAIPMLGERVGLHRAAAIVVGLAGVLVVLRPGSADLTLGHAAALAGAVFSALSSIIMRKIGRAERTVVLQLYPLLVNFVVMGAALPFVYVPVNIVDLGASAVVALLALIAMTCLVTAYRLAPAVIVAPMQYSQIIWASLFGAIFFDESLDRMTMLGTGIIIASGLYIVLREDRRKGSSQQPVLRTRTRPATPSTPRIASFLHKSNDD